MKLRRGCHRRTPWWPWAILLLVAAVALPGAAFVAAGDERDAMKENTSRTENASNKARLVGGSDRSPVADGRVREFQAGAVNRFASGVGLSSEAVRAQFVSIQGPVTVGGEIRSDPPSDGEILAALAESKRRVCWPYLHEESRSNVRIVKEKIAEYDDPPSTVPLLGRVQLHHILYKCTVYYTRRILRGWPVPQQTMEEATEVVYLDHRRYCLVGEGRTRSTAAETGDDVDATKAAP